MGLYTTDQETIVARGEYLRIIAGTFLSVAEATLLATLFRCIVCRCNVIFYNKKNGKSLFTTLTIISGSFLFKYLKTSIDKYNLIVNNLIKIKIVLN